MRSPVKLDKVKSIAATEVSARTCDWEYLVEVVNCEINKAKNNKTTPQSMGLNLISLIIFSIIFILSINIIIR